MYFFVVILSLDLWGHIVSQVKSVVQLSTKSVVTGVKRL